MTFQYKKYPVALLDSDGCEIVCCHIGITAHITECESSGLLFIGNVNHGGLSGNLLCQFVNNIKRKVEMLVIFECNTVYHTEFIHGRVNILCIYRIL